MHFSFFRIVSLGLVENSFLKNLWKKMEGTVVSITASNSSAKLNLSMSNCHKLFSSCYRKALKIIDIRKTFTTFLVAPFLEGLCTFYLSFYFITYFANFKEEGGEK